MKSRPPVVLMTATCGPTMEGPMLQNLELGKMTTIRSTTNRAELMYSVFPSEPITDHKIAGAVEQWYNTNLRDRLRLSTSQVLIYVPIKTIGLTLCGKLGLDFFESNTLPEEKQRMCDGFRNGSIQCLVATQAFGAGIDIGSVDLVIHAGSPRSMVDFAQESGRAGRKGHPALSIVFRSAQRHREEESDENCGIDEMRIWLAQSTECRRIGLGQYLDGWGKSCAMIPMAQLCDICRTNGGTETTAEEDLYTQLETRPVAAVEVDASGVTTELDSPPRGKTWSNKLQTATLKPREKSDVNLARPWSINQITPSHASSEATRLETDSVAGEADSGKGRGARRLTTSGTGNSLSGSWSSDLTEIRTPSGPSPSKSLQVRLLEKNASSSSLCETVRTGASSRRLVNIQGSGQQKGQDPDDALVRTSARPSMVGTLSRGPEELGGKRKRADTEGDSTSKMAKRSSAERLASMRPQPVISTGRPREVFSASRPQSLLRVNQLPGNPKESVPAKKTSLPGYAELMVPFAELFTKKRDVCFSCLGMGTVEKCPMGKCALEADIIRHEGERNMMKIVNKLANKIKFDIKALGYCSRCFLPAPRGHSTNVYHPTIGEGGCWIFPMVATKALSSGCRLWQNCLLSRQGAGRVGAIEGDPEWLKDLLDNGRQVDEPTFDAFARVLKTPCENGEHWFLRIFYHMVKEAVEGDER